MPRKTATLLDLGDADFAELLSSSETSTRQDIRILVEMYYDLMELRKASANRIRPSINHATSGSKLIEVFQKTIENGLEKRLEKLMDKWTDSFPEAVWVKGLKGGGPVLAAALTAYIDIRKAPTAGHIWRFAGMDPSVTWYSDKEVAAVIREVLGNKKEVTADDVIAVANSIKRKPATLLKFATTEDGEITMKTLKSALKRRPWNARLKTIAWLMATGAKYTSVSVTKTGKTRVPSYYGLVYRKRKTEEVERNLRGKNADEASRILNSGNALTANQKKFLSAGRLTDAHVDARALRYTAKLFLAHWHDKAYRAEFGEAPPKPYAIEHLGHAHYIAPPAAG
jgi:hypothetical protein